MGKSNKIYFSRTSFFVEGVPKKVVRVKGRKLSSSRKSKGILVRGIPKEVHKVKNTWKSQKPHSDYITAANSTAATTERDWQREY